MKLLLRFFGFLFAAGTILFVVGVAGAAGLLWHFSKDLPDYSQLQDYEPPVMTRVHAADGSLVGEYAREPRDFLEGQELAMRKIGVVLTEHFLGHAIGAAKVAAVGHGYAQVA